MQAVYRYCGTFFNEIEETEVTKTGITFAKTYAEAADNIGSYYGDDNIVKLMIECIGVDSCYECETKDMDPNFY